ncbi:lipopolysaccharide biosynthesis protein [Pseudoalteromonas sp. S16_S37]|uniref:lipopolysaccharide biosynthesis protein n=1 Tax=Pseudoalteromonas sp. S16_S37 TaxID=2720228 RepID=UPI00168187A3|nr:lipopolysaccharide biosynthesis protein [Pseudoalteromonas sp. S16_S37]MBD1580940.1 lipopolysaccharide biosynthesis protein [Pseudoalteromonas sp. S16_S37]
MTLISGTTIAQVLPIIAAPLLTRLYTPAEFGLFASLFAFAMILSGLVTWRYELTILLPKSNKSAFLILRLCFFLVICTSILCAALIFLFSFGIKSTLGEDYSLGVLIIVPMCVCLVGLYQSLYYWFNRVCCYSLLAKSRVLIGLSMVATQCLFGYFEINKLGLILGFAIGQAVGVLYLLNSVQLSDNFSFNSSKARIYVLAKRYINFPRFLMLAHVVNTTAIQLPNILLSSFFGTRYSGFYILLQRVVGSPISILGGAIGDVFRQKAGEQYSTNKCCDIIFISTLKKLILVSILPFGLLYAFSPYMFGVIFGEEWSKAGDYVRLLTPFFFSQFVFSPLSFMFFVAEKEKQNLLWQVTFLCVTLTSFFIGNEYGNDELALSLFSLAGMCMYTISGYMSWRYSKGN